MPPEIRYDDIRYTGESFRVDAHEMTPEGWMRVPAVIGRGDVVLPYRRADGTVRWEFRPASEVTSAESIASFEAIPVTNEHPPVHLDCGNVRAYKVGQTGTPVADGPMLRANVVIDDKVAMEDAKAGKRQVSPGYRVDLDETPGVWMGQRYDAIQRNIRGNHVAIVPLGRQGPEVALRMDSTDAVLAFDLLPNLESTDMTTKKTDDKDPKADESKNDGAEMMAKLDAMLAPMLAKVDALATKVDEMGGLMEAMGTGPGKEEKPKEDEEKPKEDEDPEKMDAAKMDAATRARLDSLEAQIKRNDEDRKAAEAKHRTDLAEASMRADVLADARRIIGDDYKATGKSRFDIMADVVIKMDGDDGKAAVDRERANVRSDAPGSEAEFQGYMKARYDGARKAWQAKADDADALLAAAKSSTHVDADKDREDKAAVAKSDAAARKKDRWKQGAAVAHAGR